jgi:hypothetical protein
LSVLLTGSRVVGGGSESVQPLEGKLVVYMFKEWLEGTIACITYWLWQRQHPVRSYE